jgi:hypothetical protein
VADASLDENSIMPQLNEKHITTAMHILSVFFAAELIIEFPLPIN